MAKLTEDEQRLLDELTARAAAPDADDEFEIEIFSGDKGARIPFSQGKKWLFETFGIGDNPTPAPPSGDGQGDGQGAGDGKGKQPPKPGGKQPPRQASRVGYFGKQG